MAVSTTTPLSVRALLSGAISGMIIFAVLVLMDHFVFSGRETAQYGLASVLIGAIVMGLIFGAIVGLVVAASSSLALGIAAGALMLAIVKVTTVDFSFGAILMGVIYGAIFGWAVASSVIKSLEEA